MPALRCGSWRASIRFCACIGTMNPPLTPPRRGTDRTRTDACSPPGRGRGWVGSWRASIRFCACIGTMNPPLTPPGRGTDWTRTDACSPPGRGWGWVGSWRDWPVRTLVRVGWVGCTVAWLAWTALLFSARAYTFLGKPPYVWPHGNVSMVLKLGAAKAPLADGNTSWDSVAGEALSTWNSYLAPIQ